MGCDLNITMDSYKLRAKHVPFKSQSVTTAASFLGWVIIVIVVLGAVVALTLIVIKVLLSVGVVTNMSLERLAVGVTVNVFAAVATALEFTMPAA